MWVMCFCRRVVSGCFSRLCCCFFFFNDTATTEIYTLSLHDALPISIQAGRLGERRYPVRGPGPAPEKADRKSTRLNSSHSQISYAVFCLKKKKKYTIVAEDADLNVAIAQHASLAPPSARAQTSHLPH